VKLVLVEQQQQQQKKKTVWIGSHQELEEALGAEFDRIVSLKTMLWVDFLNSWTEKVGRSAWFQDVVREWEPQTDLLQYWNTKVGQVMGGDLDKEKGFAMAHMMVARWWWTWELWNRFIVPLYDAATGGQVEYTFTPRFLNELLGRMRRENRTLDLLASRTPVAFSWDPQDTLYVQKMQGYFGGSTIRLVIGAPFLAQLIHYVPRIVFESRSIGNEWVDLTWVEDPDSLTKGVLVGVESSSEVAPLYSRFLDVVQALLVHELTHVLKKHLYYRVPNVDADVSANSRSGAHMYLSGAVPGFRVIWLTKADNPESRLFLIVDDGLTDKDIDRGGWFPAGRILKDPRPFYRYHSLALSAAAQVAQAAGGIGGESGSSDPDVLSPLLSTMLSVYENELLRVITDDSYREQREKEQGQGGGTGYRYFGSDTENPNHGAGSGGGGRKEDQSGSGGGGGETGKDKRDQEGGGSGQQPPSSQRPGNGGDMNTPGSGGGQPGASPVTPDELVDVMSGGGGGSGEGSGMGSVMSDQSVGELIKDYINSQLKDLEDAFNRFVRLNRDYTLRYDPGAQSRRIPGTFGREVEDVGAKVARLLVFYDTSGSVHAYLPATAEILVRVFKRLSRFGRYHLMVCGVGDELQVVDVGKKRVNDSDIRRAMSRLRYQGGSRIYPLIDQFYREHPDWATRKTAVIVVGDLEWSGPRSEKLWQVLRNQVVWLMLTPSYNEEALMKWISKLSKRRKFILSHVSAGEEQ